MPILRSGYPTKKEELFIKMSIGWLWFRGGLYGHLRSYVRVLCDDAVKFNTIISVPVLPYKRHVPSILHLRPIEKASFADALSVVTKRYDNLFSCSFAYSMGIHQRPVPSEDHLVEDGDDVAHLHVHFAPPLLRSASVRKFLVGCVWVTLVLHGVVLIKPSFSFELMAEPQRDLTAEQAAMRLRVLPSEHYLDASTFEG
jgi:UDPglucose--hexose-1-phosphate uridylyltransferase